MACNRVFLITAGENTTLITCGMLYMGSGKVELCAVCTQAKLIDDIKTFDINDYPGVDEEEEGVCKTPGCDVSLLDTTEELASQADYHGMESLTEQQQAFMEGAQAGLCPDCMV